jgi:hypothetical protein
MVEVVAGAAGGPKWLVLSGIDKAIFSNWLFERKTPVYFVGSSAGTWRLAALAQGMDAYENFLHAYLNQTYKIVPDAQTLSREFRKILDAYLDEEGIEKILNHKYARLNALSVKCRWPCSVEKTYPLMLAMMMGGILNLISRKLLKLFFSRALFFDSRDKPPFFQMEGFPLQRTPISRDNLRQVIVASGAMPVLMEGVKDIPGALPGIYRDAGIIDYHVDIPFQSDGIVLFPHYMERITTGWFDKMLPWRKPEKKNLDNVVLLCPGRAFIEELPQRKIPSREDFKTYWRRDAERMAFWQQVVSSSKILGEEFLETVENGKLVCNIKSIDVLCS